MIRLFFIIVASLLAPPLYAGSCDSFYPLGKHVSVENGVELCSSFYVVQFDTNINGAIFSSELFPEVKHTPRTNDFHPDTRLPQANQATNADYAKSGYDKGHLTPADDADDAEQEHDTFLLSNMTPQLATVNRLSWKELEMQVRKTPPDYVLTGALYHESNKTIGKHKVPVPYGYYKVVYKGCDISAYYADNIDKAPVIAVTLELIEGKSAIHFPRCNEDAIAQVQ